ncbi:YmaF family protein [Brevibacillus sp. H7]|uniref:YmaF family protein n=1 Tax=Brevibacillus sp. H7 TaxID=3349138 RepID=UPI003816C717
MISALPVEKKEHSHRITFVRYADIPGHIHSYSTRTSYDDRHRHTVQGRTTPPYPRMGIGHVHYYEGVTSFEDGHVHSFRGWTGPPIPLPDGGHYHEFGGETTFNDGHTHSYRGRTGENY